MRIQYWILAPAVLFVSACGNSQSSNQEPSPEVEDLPVADTAEHWDYETEDETNADVEKVDDDRSKASSQPEPQSDGTPEVEMRSFYSEGYHDEKPKRRGDPKVKICARNEVDEDIHFRVAQDAGGAFGTTLNKGSSFCSSDLTTGRMTVARDKQGQRYCEKRVKPGDSFSLVRFGEGGGCEWEEYQK